MNCLMEPAPMAVPHLADHVQDPITVAGTMLARIAPRQRHNADGWGAGRVRA